MSKVETYQLCHPELLSEVTLCEILKNSCIALPSLKSLSKDELIEVFKRIAMPLPQRRYNESRSLGKKLNDLRAKKGIEVASSNENTHLPSMCDPLASKTDSGVKNRLKPSDSETQQNQKKNRLSSSCRLNNISGKDMKRKSDISSISESKKRQKITWP